MASNLPFLLKLLDDESPVVQAALVEEFTALGPRLEEELVRLELTVTGDEYRRIGELQEAGRRIKLKNAWPTWLRHSDEKHRIEVAHGLLADYLDPLHRTGRLTELLDELAEEYRRSDELADSFRLAKFLFQEMDFQGSRSDYYNPANSNLVHVIEHRQGIPISLACIYMLVGRRIGVEIDGCNFPGHFLARATMGDRVMLVDCFNGGRLIEANAIRNLGPETVGGIDDYLRIKTRASTIIERVLNNLSNSFNLIGDGANSAFMKELLYALQRDT